MHAQKMMLDTDQTGKPVNWPALPPNRHFEVIFLDLSESSAPKQSRSRRQPHPHVAGHLKVTGNIIDSVPEKDWDLPK